MAIRTRSPFRGVIDKVEITFKGRIKLAERVAIELGLPWEKEKIFKIEKQKTIEMGIENQDRRGFEEWLKNKTQ